MKPAMKKKLQRNAIILVLVLLVLTYYLSSIPYLRVLPVLSQINDLLMLIDLRITDLARAVVNRLPSQLDSMGTLSGDFYNYARQNPLIMEFLLRKLAHVVLFFIITLAFFIFWRHHLKPLQAVFASFFCGTLSAILDEIHQYYVVGRSGNIIDVLINMAGVMQAVFLIAIAFLLVKPVYDNPLINRNKT